MVIPTTLGVRIQSANDQHVSACGGVCEHVLHMTHHRSQQACCSLDLLNTKAPIPFSSAHRVHLQQKAFFCSFCRSICFLLGRSHVRRVLVTTMSFFCELFLLYVFLQSKKSVLCKSSSIKIDFDVESVEKPTNCECRFFLITISPKLVLKNSRFNNQDLGNLKYRKMRLSFA